MTDEQIIVAAIAQGQIADIVQSGVLAWQLSHPYGLVAKSAQILYLNGKDISLINLNAESPLPKEDWNIIRQVWWEAREQPKIEWRPAVKRLVDRQTRTEAGQVAHQLLRGLAGSAEPRNLVTLAAAQLTALIDSGTVYNPTPSYHYQEGIMGEVLGSSGYASLDRLLFGGLWTQALIIVGMPSNHGKSTLAYSLIAKAVASQRRVVLFTFETNTATAVARVLSALLGLPLSEALARIPKKEADQRKITEGLTLIDEYFSIYDLTFNDPGKIEQAIRLTGPKLAIIDHLGMIDPKSAVKNAKMYDPAGDVADMALQWSIKYGMTILINAQFSNTIQAELKKNHDLAHTTFFGSSRVYNAADFAIIGLRHWSLPSTAYFRLKKNRKTGIVDIDAYLKHNPWTQSYEETT